MCDCIEKTQESLKTLGKNTQLVIPLVINRIKGVPEIDRVVVATCKLDDRNKQKPITLLATYCPFCGEKYNPIA